jgi:hypothetical protein
MTGPFTAERAEGAEDLAGTEPAALPSGLVLKALVHPFPSSAALCDLRGEEPLLRHALARIRCRAPALPPCEPGVTEVSPGGGPLTAERAGSGKRKPRTHSSTGLKLE